MFHIFQCNIGLSTAVHSSGWFMSIESLVCRPAQYLDLNGVFGCLEGLYSLVMGRGRKAPSIYLRKKRVSLNEQKWKIFFGYNNVYYRMLFYNLKKKIL